MAVTQTIKLDLNNHKADDIILRVGESYTRKIVFIPGTYDGNTFTPTVFSGREAGPRVLFRMVKPDRTFVMQNLTVVHEEPDTGVYSFELVPDEYMSQVGGIGYYDLRINDSDTEEEFLYTVQGRVLIDDDMITDSMIESVAAANGMDFPDDFITNDDLSDYATKQYVDDAISEIPKSSLIELYNNNTAIGASSITVANHEKYKFYIFEFYHYVSDISDNKVLTYFCVNANGNYIFTGCSTSMSIMYGRDILISGNTISWGNGMRPGVEYSNNYFIPHKIYGLEV